MNDDTLEQAGGQPRAPWQYIIEEIDGRIGREGETIAEAARGGPDKLSTVRFTVRELRLIRFGLKQASEFPSVASARICGQEDEG